MGWLPWTKLTGLAPPATGAVPRVPSSSRGCSRPHRRPVAVHTQSGLAVGTPCGLRYVPIHGAGLDMRPGEGLWHRHTDPPHRSTPPAQMDIWAHLPTCTEGCVPGRYVAPEAPPHPSLRTGTLKRRRGTWPGRGPWSTEDPTPHAAKHGPAQDLCSPGTCTPGTQAAVCDDVPVRGRLGTRGQGCDNCVGLG